MKNLIVVLLKPRAWVAKSLILIMAIGFAALHHYGYLKPITDFLGAEALTVKIGEYNLSALFVCKVIFSAILVFWLTGIVSEFGEQKIKKFNRIKASNRALLTKAFQVLVYFIAFLISLDLLGLDLTGLTVFSGAIGIGIGIGLQKISSNFISGIIMLSEKAVKEGDLIELSDGTSGIVRNTGARFTRIETLESRDIMIPNEDFITDRITNWTYSDNLGRVDIEIGVAYGSDLHKVYQLLIESANEHPRCCKSPEALCFLDSFGDNSINFLLYFWVEDIIVGRKRPKSEVLFSIWEKFNENGIQIPFPQRDIHIKSGGPLTHE